MGQYDADLTQDALCCHVDRFDLIGGQDSESAHGTDAPRHGSQC